MNSQRLSKLVAHVCEVRMELRSQDASETVIAQATERVVRDAWEPLVPDQRFWPVQHTLARCVYCDGTGLMLRFNVKNRLGLMVTEGEPCRCPKGARFIEKPKGTDDHTAAGKVQKPMTRFGR